MLISNSFSLIYDTISTITPFDHIEKKQKRETLEWIQSGVQVYRTSEANIPQKHLVSYFVLLDQLERKILLVDHIKAQLWLPPGGHVERDEDPLETVKRECLEELQVEASFIQEKPLFLTVTDTVGNTAPHTDVSLWYLLEGSQKNCYRFDTREFHKIKWFSFDQIPYSQSDPNLKRFMQKISYLK